MQTTYENFRFRYSRKQNPYNKGVIGNFKEVFCSKIPPSMNNFRAIAEEDEVTIMEPTSHTSTGNGAVSEKQADTKMGTTFDENDKTTLPSILRNIELDDIEDNLRNREAIEGSDFNPIAIPVEQDLGKSANSLPLEVKPKAEEKCDGEISETE